MTEKERTLSLNVLGGKGRVMRGKAMNRISEDQREEKKGSGEWELEQEEREQADRISSAMTTEERKEKEASSYLGICRRGKGRGAVGEVTKSTR